MTTSAPPARAQDLLALVTPVRDRDSIIGDLLEEYSETVLPERGLAAARWWYRRQVWGFVWRACHPAGTQLGGYLSGRLLLDIVTPSGPLAARETITACLALALYALWGFRAGRRTGRAASGAVVATAATLLGVAQVMMLALLIAGLAGPWVRPHPAAWAGLIHGFDQPIVPMLLLGGIIGSLAAALGTRHTSLTSRQA